MARRLRTTRVLLSLAPYFVGMAFLLHASTSRLDSNVRHFPHDEPSISAATGQTPFLTLWHKASTFELMAINESESQERPPVDDGYVRPAWTMFTISVIAFLYMWLNSPEILYPLP